MKQIKLKRLTLKDWRTQSRTIEFSDNTEIHGYNKSGKSTLKDGFLWLMTGADDCDRTNFNLFDTRVEQTYENSKKASVEGVLDIDGVEYVLTKTAEQGWVHNKRTAEYERKGTDSYGFFIDGIERSATDYKKFIEDMIAPIGKLKIMLNIGFFLMLDWKEMRRSLETLVGEITDEDFKGDYSSIRNELAKYSIEDIKTSLKSKVKPLESSLKSLPVEISTLKSTLPDISDIESINAEIEKAKSEIADIDAQMLGINDTIKSYISKRNADIEKISLLKQQYAERKSEYESKSVEIATDIKAQMAQIDLENAKISSENALGMSSLANAKESLKMALSKLDSLNKYRKDLLAQNSEVKAMQFTDDKCPYCGQKLPYDKMDEARNKFLRNKEAKHNAIVSEGKANNVKIEQCREDIEKYEAIVNAGFKEKPLRDKSELEAKLSAMRANFIPFGNTEEGIALSEQIRLLSENITEVPSQNTLDMTSRKKELYAKIEELSKEMKKKDYYDSIIYNIQHKEDCLRNTASELAFVKGKLNKVVEYEREKALIISDRVNGKFSYISVVMTETNKSGELVDTCRINDCDGADAQTTNTASRVLCGIDIATAFQNHYGLRLPVWVDCAESVNKANLPEFDRQVVKLYADECPLTVNTL